MGFALSKPLFKLGARGGTTTHKSPKLKKNAGQGERWPSKAMLK